jgi:hypothetical protein
LTGTPSISTRVLSVGAPRIDTSVRPPKAPDWVTTTPGAVDRMSAANVAWRASMSASVMT